jgi:hypothetical protein
LKITAWSSSLGQVREEQITTGIMAEEATACMNDQSDVPREYEQVPRELLKHGTGRLSHVILVPQPTDSQNDPLNVRVLHIF